MRCVIVSINHYLSIYLDISDSDAGLKEEKLEGSVGGEGDCGDEVEVLLMREI